MTALTSKDFLSHFGKNDESEAGINNTSLKRLLVNNNEVAGNKGKIKGHVPLTHIFKFCRTFEIITNQFDLHLAFKTVT